MDEVSGLRIDLEHRPVTGVGHARHEWCNDVAAKIVGEVGKRTGGVLRA